MNVVEQHASPLSFSPAPGVIAISFILFAILSRNIMIRRASSSIVRSCQQGQGNTLHPSWRSARTQQLGGIPALSRLVRQSPTRDIHHVVRPVRHSGHLSSTNIRSSTASPINIPSTSQTNIQLYNVYEARSFSAAAAASNSTTDTTSKSDDKSQQSKDKGDGEKSKKKEDNSNIFLDNLGKIFLSTIAAVLVMLLRSTKSNNARSALREDIETSALLDPLEIDDLRLANSDFTIDVWEKIAAEIQSEFRSREVVTYPEFLTVVMRVMKDLKGEGFTIQFGHLVDRVVIAELERITNRGEDGSEEDQRMLLQNELPLSFLFAALSLALHSTVTDRVRVLYGSMLESGLDNNNNTSVVDEESTTVSGEQVSQMIQHLQNTCQLVSEAQIVETNSKVPYQTYRVGTGDDLTKRAREGFGGKKGSAGVTREKEGPVSLEEFHAILKSRTVCAWGECYVKKTGSTSTSDR